MIECIVAGIKLYPEVEKDIIVVKSNTSLNISGTHSMEICFPLSNKENAKFFKSQNLINIEEKQRCFSIVLKADGIKVIDGTLQVMSVDEQIVRTQASEGELSAAVNVDKCTVRELNLGRFELFGHNEANDLEGKFFPETNFCFPFLIDREHFQREMETTSNDGVSFNRKNFRLNRSFSVAQSPQMVQIYFLSVVEKIFKACGYIVDFSSFFSEEKNQIFKKLYIVSGLSNSEVNYSNNANIPISHILPNWNITDFFEEVRMFLNVYFEFEGEVVKLVPRKRIFDNKKVYVDNKDIIKGEYAPQNEYVETEENDLVGYLNFGYDLEDSEFNKFQNIDKKIYDSCNIVDVSEKDRYPIDAQTLFEENNEAKTKFCKVKDREWQRCATMQDYIQDEKEEVRKGKIVPAEIEECKLNIIDVYDEKSMVIVYAIAPKTKIYNEYGIKGAKLGDLIREGVKIGEVPQRIEVAFLGEYVEKGWNEEVTDAIKIYAQKQSHVWPRYEEEIWANGNKQEALKMNLSPEYMFHTYYEGTYKADFTKEYKIAFLTQNYPDPASIFFINQRAFCCKEYKITLVKGKSIGMVEGIFYKMI